MAAGEGGIMLQLKSKLQRSTEEGFTLLETLVAMLVATTFVAATMQAMVIAAYSRIRAQETSEATALIQEDLENLKYEASQLTYAGNESKCNASSKTEGFADALRDKVIGSDSSSTETVYPSPENPIPSSNTGKAYNLKKTLTLPDNAPFNVLKVSYEVKPSSGGDPVAEMYTEVIPDAAFEC